MSFTPQTEQKMRRVFHKFNHFMIMMWRLGLGKFINIAPKQGGKIMVITHFGRKSGKRYYTPVNYAEIDDEIYCTAGFGSISDWYRNILVNPSVEVWLSDSWWSGSAEDITDHPQHVDIMRQVLIASGAVAPLLGVDPVKLNNNALDQITRSYRLIHLRRTAARTGSGGPGDLAWVWPAATFLLLPITFFLLLTRPRRR